MPGIIKRIAGPVVFVYGLEKPKKNYVVEVGEERLLGEIIQIRGDTSVIQVYEETSGLGIKEPVSIMMEERPVLSEDIIPKGPESVDVMIARAQGLVKASAIEDAQRLCDEIEKISKEEQFSSEDLKKIEYSLMEIKTDIKLAKLD